MRESSPNIISADEAHVARRSYRRQLLIPEYFTCKSLRLKILAGLLIPPPRKPFGMRILQREMKKKLKEYALCTRVQAKPKGSNKTATNQIYGSTDHAGNPRINGSGQINNGAYEQ